MKFNRSDAPERFKLIRLLILDVDGVLTCGEVIYDDPGRETKIFNVRDGLGLRLVMHAGIGVCVATGRSTPALIHRLKNLGISQIFDGLRHKSEILEPLTRQTGLTPTQMGFVGDDLPDLGLMALVGLGIAVADAAPEVLTAADAVTTARGGRGAVREVCEEIIKAQGLWEKLVENIKQERL